MAAFASKLKAVFGNHEDASKETTPPAAAAATASGPPDELAKESGANGIAPVNSHDESDPEKPAEDLQRGVQQAEAMTLTWTKWELIGVFFNIWLLYFVNAMQDAILASLVPFVTSEFESHSLLNVIYIVGDAIAAACFIPISKILDVWGRAQGYIFMIVLATLGLILMASCKNLPTFCAAYVFYHLGFRGMTFCIDIITADISKLKNRGLAYAITSSPFIITAFAGPKAAEDFYEKITWRWGFGAFAIILPVVAAPLFFVIRLNIAKAKLHGVVSPEKVDRSLAQSIWHYVVEFDALGVFLLSAGLTIFLLPFTLAANAPDGWRSDYIIAMLVVGFVLLGLFTLHEWLWAPKPMLSFQFLADRTVIGTCMLGSTYMVSYYCWANYFSSFLQVVNDITQAQAGYISNTFNVVSGVLLLIVGWLIRRTGYFKWLLYIAVPIYVFALGLMIHFRRPDQSVGFLVMCEIFISIGGSIFILVQQVSIQAAVDHQHIAAVMALLYVASTIAGAIGATISGTIWTNTFPLALQRFLPPESLPDLETIYGDIEVQLSYAVGTDTRIAIQQAYGYAQTRMLAAGTSILIFAFIATFLIRNINVAKISQVKGMVF